VATLLRGERQRLRPTTLAMADVAYDVLLKTDLNIASLPISHTDEWDTETRTRTRPCCATWPEWSAPVKAEDLMAKAVRLPTRRYWTGKTPTAPATGPTSAVVGASDVQRRQTPRRWWQNEGNADRRVRQGHDPRRRPQAVCTCLRSRRRPNQNIAATSTDYGQLSHPKRRAARCTIGGCLSAEGGVIVISLIQLSTPCPLARYCDIVTDAARAVMRTALTPNARKFDRTALGPVGGAAIKPNGSRTNVRQRSMSATSNGT
jgi:hypothetical protein